MTRSIGNRRTAPPRRPSLGGFVGLLAARWRRSPSLLWTAVPALLAAVMALPLITVALLSATAPASVWPQLARTVLPATLIDTSLVLGGVGFLTLAFGASA